MKTRFAPSPTGYLHIGGLRTALYSWLYAQGREGNLCCVLKIQTGKDMLKGRQT